MPTFLASQAETKLLGILSRSPGWASALGLSVVVGGLVTLFGWWFHVMPLAHWHLSLVAMNPLTAVGFVVLGLGIVTSCWYPDKRGARAFCGAAVTLLGIQQLLRYFGMVDLGIDQWFFADRLGDNRMAPNTAAALVISGLALLLLETRLRRGGVWLGELLALGTAAASMVSMVGYAYGAEALYRFSHWIPMAMNTALLFQAAALGLLFARPQRGVMRLLLSPTLGGIMARRMLPFAVLVPGLLGWIRLVGQRSGWFELEIGLAYSVAITMILFALVIIWSAWIVSRADQQRQEAAESLRRRSQEVFDLYNHAPCGYHSLDAQGRMIAMNDTELRWLGYTREEIVDRRDFASLLTPESRRVFVEQFEQFKKRGLISDLELTLVRGDGSHLPIILSATAIYDGQGDYLASRSTVFDATRLKKAEQDIRELNESLELRVRERTRQLAQANSELAQKSQENEMFVYSVSHDLRSPLVNLQGFSQELNLAAEELRSLLKGADLPAGIRQRSEQLLNEEVQTSLSFIQSAVIRLAGIIDALLKLSRVGRVEYQVGCVDLNQMLARIRDAAQQTIHQVEAQLILEDLPPARGDTTALEQVFANLVDNALKYRHPERPAVITVGSLDANGSSLPEKMRTYFVHDNGPGIPENQREKVFEVFRRLEPHRSSGEGMGLSIVRRIVERHGGTVWVESDVGEGTTFYLTLPIGDPATREVSEKAAELERSRKVTNGPSTGNASGNATVGSIRSSTSSLDMKELPRGPMKVSPYSPSPLGEFSEPDKDHTS
jgi:PAS domain S-box-containing protein